MKKIFKSGLTAITSTSVDVEDVAFREAVSPVFDEAPCLVYNPHDAGSIVAASILQGERGWRVFKAGESLPMFSQYIWLGVEPNRVLFEEPTLARKAEHLVFLPNKHPMTAKVAVWGEFKLVYAGWTYSGGKPDPLGFLLEKTLGAEKFQELSMIMELANKFYDRPVGQGINRQAMFSELCSLACVWRNVINATYCIRHSTKFVPVGVGHDDVSAYLNAVTLAKESLDDMRVETVFDKDGKGHPCCLSSVSQDFWLVKRIVGFSYKYWLNLGIGLTGTVLTTNVVKTPDQFEGAVILR